MNRLCKQLDLFDLVPAGSDLVKICRTVIEPFGEHTHVAYRKDGVVRGASLIECDDPDVVFFNSNSPVGSM